MAQSVSGTNLTANWQAADQHVVSKVELYWGEPTGWVDETARCVGVMVVRHSLLDASLSLPSMSGGLSSTATLSLDNADGRFSPDVSGSMANTYYPQGIYRLPIRISAGLWDSTNGPECLRQFTGYVESAPVSERNGESVVQFTCRDLSLELEQDKRFTTLYTDKRPDEWIQLLVTGHYSGGTELQGGVFTIPYCWLDDDNVWQDLADIASSEAGMVLIDKSGVLCFWRATALLERADSLASVATLSRGRCWTLGSSLTWRNLYGSVRVPYEPREPGQIDVLYAAQDTLEVAPNDELVHVAELRWPTDSIEAPVATVDYHALSGGYRDMRDDLSVSCEWYASKAQVTFTNTSNERMYIMGFQLRGVPLLGEGAQIAEATAESSAPLYDIGKDYLAATNPYRQTEEQAQYVADVLRDRLQYPRTLWRYEGPLCPWLELGDRVTLVNSAHGLNDDMYVMQIDQSVSHSTQDMTLTLLPADSLYAQSAQFLIGTDSYGGSAKVGY